MTPNFVQILQSAGKSSRNCILKIYNLVVRFHPTSTDSDYIKFAQYNIKIPYCHNVCNCLCETPPVRGTEDHTDS
jgi:hypothetical protein